MKRLLTSLTVVTVALAGLVGSASAQTVVVPGPPISIAQRIFQGIEHFAPRDSFSLQPDFGGPDFQLPRDTASPENSGVSFYCNTCGTYDLDSLFLGYFTSHSEAISNAVSTIQFEGNTPVPLLNPNPPVYVAGDATMTGPVPPRIVRAFSLAVRKPVVTYKHW